MKTMNCPISEIFYSIQWEWRNTWKPAIFVRFWWCNLKCTWCDSKYSWQDKKDLKFLTVAQVVKKIKSLKCKHIIYTWWEPALFETQIAEIKSRLAWYTHEIETNWSILLKNYYDQINISYKLRSSWNKSYKAYFPIKADLKFVVGSSKDIGEILKIQSTIKYISSKIYIMPLWITIEDQLKWKNYKRCVEACKKYWWNLSLRMHILLFGNHKWV